MRAQELFQKVSPTENLLSLGLKLMKIKTLTIVTMVTISSYSFAHDIGQEHEHIEGGWNAKAGFVSDTDHTAQLWNPRGKSQAEIIKRAIFLAEKYDLERTPEQIERANQARTKYQDAIAINSILPTSDGIIGQGPKHMKKAVLRNQKAGMTVASSTVYAFPGAIPEDATAYSVVAASQKVADEFGSPQAFTVQDIRETKAAGKTAFIYNTQGSDYVVEDMEFHAKQSYEAGIRTMNFTYNKTNKLAGGNSEPKVGLTELGKQWIDHANNAGIVIDVSHSSSQTAIDAANYAKKPIIASHSNAFALMPQQRNLSDEAIEAIGKNGGAICPTGVGVFLNAELDASPERYVEHVVYIADKIGKDKVCFSTDYVHGILDFYKRDIPNVDIYPPEQGFSSPLSNMAAENIWDVAALLEDKYGWTDEEVRGFLGENLMRVYAENWKS